MKKYLIAILACLILACTADGPQQTLDKLAKAMDNNDSQAFLEQFDMDAYSASFLKSMTQQNEALHSLSALGKMFGLGNLDQLVTSIVNVKAELAGHFNRGVASGELMAQCRKAATPDCPWVPQSLREAQIREIAADAAIAKVTNPEHMTCWLALHKFGQNWLVVGRAVLEADAAALAQNPPAGAGQKQPGKAGQGDVSI